MKQLMMLWEKQPLKQYQLPEYFSIRHFREGDEQGWLDVCADANLGTDNWTIEEFYKNMLNTEGIDPEGIFFVVDQNGRIAGTATGWLKTEPGLGYLHNVAIHPKFRGMGLGKPLNCSAMDYLVENGSTKVSLNTDDYRIPAIKIYLWLGFKPVLYDADMEERWIVIMKTISLQQLAANTAKREFIKQTDFPKLL